MTAAADAASNDLQAEAFKRLYPDQYYSKFVDNDVRPDGRPLNGARVTTIGLHPVESAHSSALVKVGSTAAIAGIKLQHCALSDGDASEDRIKVAVEMAAFASSEMRPGRPSEAVQVVQNQIRRVLRCGGAVAWEDLAIDRSNAWTVYLDIYVLDADGALLDVCLLAAVASLLGLRLPRVEVNSDGQVVSRAHSDVAEQADAQHFRLRAVPMALTCAMYDGRLIADPTSEEEALAASLVSTIVDTGGRLIGLYKAGGSVELEGAQLQQCMEAAKLRYADVKSLLNQALADKDIPLL